MSAARVASSSIITQRVRSPGEMFCIDFTIAQRSSQHILVGPGLTLPWPGTGHLLRCPLARDTWSDHTKRCIEQ
jgi:hypothetical protein